MSLKHRHSKRECELKSVFSRINVNTADLSVLEIGSGTGYQLELLSLIFEKAKGIDIEESNYRDFRSNSVIVYDSKNIPFSEDSFDCVFSSNTLEHIPHLEEIDKEINRVLKNDGIAIHILPTHIWRFWTIITHYFTLPERIFRMLTRKKTATARPGENLKRDMPAPLGIKYKLLEVIFPSRHGERGNRFTELFYFHPNWWLSFFKKQNWEIIDSFPVGLFYTGNSILGESLSLVKRITIAKVLGSACHTYVLRKGSTSK